MTHADHGKPIHSKSGDGVQISNIPSSILILVLNTVQILIVVGKMIMKISLNYKLMIESFSGERVMVDLNVNDSFLRH